jgi:RHS repeat-associated protein
MKQTCIFDVTTTLTSTLTTNYCCRNKRSALFNGKELDEENGMYYYSARYYNPPTFISRDPLFEKYPSVSPYAYCANNPLKYIDPTGMEVEDAELYKTDKNGNYINAKQVKAFEAFMNTKEGRAEIAKYAKAGQTIGGHTFESDGEYHKAGVDVALGGDEGLPRSYSGQTGKNIVDGRLKLSINISDGDYRATDVGDVMESFAHELLIHGRQYVRDFKDNRKMDNSHAYKELYNFAKERGTLNDRYIHHYQELNSDKVMEKVGIPILQQYYNGIGKSKSKQDLMNMIKFVP